MQIIITGKDFKLTPSLKRFVTEKFEKLARYSERIISVKIELDVDRRHKKGDNCRVQVWVTLPQKILQAGLKGQEMHEVIDLVLPKIEQQIRRYKDKMKDKQKRQKSIRK